MKAYSVLARIIVSWNIINRCRCCLFDSKLYIELSKLGNPNSEISLDNISCNRVEKYIFSIVPSARIKIIVMIFDLLSLM